MLRNVDPLYFMSNLKYEHQNPSLLFWKKSKRLDHYPTEAASPNELLYSEAYPLAADLCTRF